MFKVKGKQQQDKKNKKKHSNKKKLVQLWFYVMFKVKGQQIFPKL